MTTLEQGSLLALNGASFLEGAPAGVSLSDAQGMLDALYSTVTSFDPFRGASMFNSEALNEDFSDGEVSACFELSRQVSLNYIIALRFQWRVSIVGESTLVGIVSTSRIHDGRGIFSQNGGIEDEMESDFVLKDHQTVESFLQAMYEQAIDYHVELLRKVGVCGSALENTPAKGLGVEGLARALWTLK